MLAVLLLIFLGDLIRFYRNIRREPLITSPQHRFYLTATALAGGGGIFLLLVSHWYPFTV
nr:hypothetical protein [Morganella morganii]